MTIPYVPTYSGEAPNRNTQTSTVFSANSDDSLLYQTTLATNINLTVDEMNILAGNVNLNFIEMAGYTEKVIVGTTVSNVIDASTTNVVTISDGATAVSVTDVPVGSYTLTLILTDSTIDLAALSIKWCDGTAPTWTTDDDLIFLTTIDQGTNWYGTATTGYV